MLSSSETRLWRQSGKEKKQNRRKRNNLIAQIQAQKRSSRGQVCFPPLQDTLENFYNLKDCTVVQRRGAPPHQTPHFRIGQLSFWQQVIL